MNVALDELGRSRCEAGGRSLCPIIATRTSLGRPEMISLVNVATQCEVVERYFPFPRPLENLFGSNGRSLPRSEVARHMDVKSRRLVGRNLHLFSKNRHAFTCSHLRSLALLEAVAVHPLRSGDEPVQTVTALNRDRLTARRMEA